MAIQKTRTPTTSNVSQSSSQEQLRRMIAEAAYFRAQARGFNGGDPVEDWLAAEQEVAKKIKKEK
ncbi:MAG: DUF2934 domain-containing protein [Gammaproteobacteria bacterium]|nr:DUF2934 domain-containing protein [Gammaproteobacteria bacterium]